MALIPSSINGVSVEFDVTVIRDVDPRVIDALRFCIHPDIGGGVTLQNIYIFSAYDKHHLPSRHMQHKAVDISRVNDTKIGIGYQLGGAVRTIVNAIQEEFEKFPHRRENFGPALKHKLGHPYFVSGHDDHVHFSVN